MVAGEKSGSSYAHLGDGRGLNVYAKRGYYAASHEAPQNLPAVFRKFAKP